MKPLFEDLESILKNNLSLDDIYFLNLLFINAYHIKNGVSVKDYYDYKNTAEKLYELGIIDKINDITYKANKKTKETLYNVVLNNVQSFDDAKKLDLLLKRKFNSKSTIALNIFKRYSETEKYIKPVTQLSGQEYESILKILKKYQTDSNVNLLSRLKKYTGLINDLFIDDTLILYRGIQLSNNSDSSKYYDKSKLKIGGKFTPDKPQYSWSKDINIAKSFAYGNTSWIGNKTCFVNNDYGIILRQVFDKKNIICDFGYLNEKHPFFEQFQHFEEDEVIINPAHFKSFTIHKILTNKCK